MNNMTESVVSIVAAIIGVTILAVIVSKRSNTVGVIQAGASGLGNLLAVAVSPIGNPVKPLLSYPSMGLDGGLPAISGG